MLPTPSAAISAVIAAEAARAALTADVLRSVLNYDPITGVFTWIGSRGRFGAKPGLQAGYIDTRGYVHICLNRSLFKSHRLAWLFVYGKWPDGDVDHINGQPGDNRIANLRDISHAQNLLNTKLFATNTSGSTGVYWGKRAQKWFAKIVVDGKQTHLGFFSNKTDAEVARLSAVEALIRGPFRAQQRSANK